MTKNHSFFDGNKRTAAAIFLYFPDGSGILLSVVTATKCRQLTAAYFSEKMLKKAEKNCPCFCSSTYAQADITALPYPDSSFSKAAAGDVIHLPDNPLRAPGD